MPASAQPKAFSIVAIAGEDAVNIIQQKTAVAPIVEVRDENDLPIAGVLVTFRVRGKGATIRGLQQVTVTTNAAGQASAQITPAAAGQIRIEAIATYQGHSAATSITQTNFATVAEAQAAGKTPGTSTAATGVGAGAGSGGIPGAMGGVLRPAARAIGRGISRAVVGVVGVAVGGGLLVAVANKVGEGLKDSGVVGTSETQPVSMGTPTPAPSPTPTPAPLPPQPASGTYAGTVDGTHIVTYTLPIGACNVTFRLSGTIRIALDIVTDSASSGLGDWHRTTVSQEGSCFGISLPTGDSASQNLLRGQVSGSRTSLRFSDQTNVDGTNLSAREAMDFVGSLDGDSITGQLTFVNSGVASLAPGVEVRYEGRSTTRVTLVR